MLNVSIKTAFGCQELQAGKEINKACSVGILLHIKVGLSLFLQMNLHIVCTDSLVQRPSCLKIAAFLAEGCFIIFI